MKFTAEEFEICRSCLALNNIGVTLLEGYHFREASKTFRIALSALKPLLCKGTKVISYNDMMSLQVEVTKASAKATNRQERLRESIDIFAIDEGDDDAFQAAQQYGPSASVAFPIRIRTLPSLESVQQEGLNFHAAVLIYNCGLARLLVHRFARISPHDKFLTEALHLLATAEKVVSRYLYVKEEERPLNFLYLNCLILGNIAWVFHLQGRRDKVVQVNESLSYLDQLQQIWEFEASTFCCREHLAAAAA